MPTIERTYNSLKNELLTIKMNQIKKEYSSLLIYYHRNYRKGMFLWLLCLTKKDFKTFAHYNNTCVILIIYCQHCSIMSKFQSHEMKKGQCTYKSCQRM